MIWHRLSVHSLLYACLAFLLLARGDAWALGSTPVTVVNPTDIAKAEGIQHPFQQSASCGFDISSPIVCNAIVPVPTSQRLVIEYVSGSCFVEVGNALTAVSVTTTAGGVEAGHVLGIVDHFGVGTVGFAQTGFGQTVRIYADQGSQLIVNAGSLSRSDGGCSFTLSGQAIDVP